MVEMRGFHEKGETIVDFLPLSRFSEFYFDLQTKGYEK